MMDRLSIQASEQSVHAGFPTDAGAALIVELDGAVESARPASTASSPSAAPTRARDPVARDEVERATIWKARKAAFASMGRVATNYYVQDGVIPRTRLPEILHRITELSEEYGMRVANVFHAGDGNLHRSSATTATRRERAEELAGRIVEACVEAGGSITASTASASTRSATWARCSASPISPRSRAALRASIPTASPIPAR